MPKLSVIVPVYNTEKYLRECIDSILAQTFTDFELILVDDGSTDHSGAICDEYAGKDARIRVIHQENGGITVARKSGVRVAVGEYVTFVDSDDWIDKDMYSTMLNCQNDTMPDVIICGMLMETPQGTVPRKRFLKAGIYDKQRMRKEIYPVMLFDFVHCMPGIAPSFCNKVLKKHLLENVIEEVKDSITYGEDALCTYACLLDAELMQVVDMNLYHYRNHAESVSNGHSCFLLKKFSLLIAEMQLQFQNREFNMKPQLFGYTARHSLECIRAEFLYHRGVDYGEKRRMISAFLSEPMVDESIAYTIRKISNFKTRLKLYLSGRKWITALYGAYLVQNYLLIRKRNNYEN